MTFAGSNEAKRIAILRYVIITISAAWTLARCAVPYHRLLSLVTASLKDVPSSVSTFRE